MSQKNIQKSTVEEIRKRFDADVDRFSNLETGQQATIDAPLVMELITRAALSINPNMKTVLDIGCGAGNNTMKLLQFKSPLDCSLVDLSLPMLVRAEERISRVNTGQINRYHGDIREIDLPKNCFDTVFAAAVLHHLRDDEDWEYVFEKIYRATSLGGSVWITDLVYHEHPAVQGLMWRRYGDYLESLGGPKIRDLVFSCIEKEDSPRPVTYQMELLRKVGFEQVDLLHKNSCFAAFGGVKKNERK